MDILERILQLREEKGWSEYKLSVESGIPQSTISSWFRKKAQPSVQSLQAICDACGITLSQFFNDTTHPCSYLTDRQQKLLAGFAHLDNEQQGALIRFLETFGQ